MIIGIHWTAPALLTSRPMWTSPRSPAPAETQASGLMGRCAKGDFLNRLGLPQRLEHLLAATPDEDMRTQLQSGAARLTDGDAMGTLFKVLSLSSPGMAEPPGFS